MILNRKTLIFAFLTVTAALSCCRQPDMTKAFARDLEVAGSQLSRMAEAYDTATVFARSWSDGVFTEKTYRDWTCGFFPGSLWLYYEMSGNAEFAEMARHFTAKVRDVPKMTNTHDLGFMVLCSYGRQWHSDRDSISAAAVIQASKMLISRFNPGIGAIRSWDFGEWNYPVIIDNMMNLEMLFQASEMTGDPVYREVAVLHADKTINNHFREDTSSWHVVSYNDDGSVECKETYQGFSANSRWARGQAWGLYGYTVCYRYTSEPRYLDQARSIADMIISQVKTSDAIPYWDYDAPGIPNEPRDASAAAITASALLELQGMVEGAAREKYLAYAAKILSALSSPDYLAEPGANGFFVLRHSTGAAPFDSEVDTPLNYADYYFLEAIQRYAALKGIDTKQLTN